jgi:hypothetical protein
VELILKQSLSFETLLVSYSHVSYQWNWLVLNLVKKKNHTGVAEYQENVLIIPCQRADDSLDASVDVVDCNKIMTM